MKNEYIPYPAKIKEIREETFDTKTFRLQFLDEKFNEVFQYKSGQFMGLSVLGVGEAPISITSSPSRKGFLEFTIRATGKVTDQIHKLKVGEIIHLRGPYGNSFPFDEIKGKNLLFLAGGIGLVPLRSLINEVFDSRDQFGNIKILYGSKTCGEFCFKDELDKWPKIPQTEVLLTVDKDSPDWEGNVGVVTGLCNKTELCADNSVVIVCGPPVMIKFSILKILEYGFKEEQIYATLERYMKCGIGKCGHCNIGKKFVCIDGPVFSYQQLKELPLIKEGVF